MNAKVIFLAPYRFWAYLGFVLGTAYQYGIMEILIGVIKDTVPGKIEHHLMGMCASGLDRFCCGLRKPLLSIQQKTPKTNHQRSALS